MYLNTAHKLICFLPGPGQFLQFTYCLDYKAVSVAFLTTFSQNHHVWWRSLKYRKRAAVCSNKNAKNCAEESWRYTSSSEGGLGEFSVLVQRKGVLLSCSLDLHDQNTYSFSFLEK